MNSDDTKNGNIALMRAWTEASRLLEFEIVAPFTLRHSDRLADCFAFLPYFGSRNGIVLGLTTPPDFDVDASLIDLAEKAQLFCSFINPQTYIIFKEERFKEALLDWGFYGPPNKRPRWWPTT